MYYTIRGAIPEFFANRDPHGKGVAKVLEKGPVRPSAGGEQVEQFAPTFNPARCLRPE